MGLIVHLYLECKFKYGYDSWGQEVTEGWQGEKDSRIYSG